jgi:energy-converting hydrogenase B subunit D
MDSEVIGGLLDAVLALTLVASAWLALYRSGSRRAVLLYFAFGFLMTLAWVRLDAPDLALAEAAVGAGVTAALLIGLLGRLKPPRDG